MELFIIMATVAFICRDPAGTIKAATSHKRAQIERARAKNPKVRHPGHRALRNYVGTVWEAQWDQACERYPERMRAAQQRRADRKAKREATWDQVQERAGQRWDERFPEQPGAEPEEALDPATATGGEVVDLDAERKRRAGAAGPTPDPEPDTTTPQEEPMNLSDATSLRAHLAALREHADYQDRTCTAKEQLASGMRESGVGESTVAAVDASRAASAHAAAMARAAAEALEAANMAVAEARASSTDAGDGGYYERR